MLTSVIRMRQYSNVILLLLIIVGVILYGCLSNKGVNEEKECNIQNQSEKDICYYNLALEKNNISICKNIKTEYIQFTCDYKFLKRVESEEDFPISLCNEVKNFGNINLSIDKSESFSLGADIKLMGIVADERKIKDSCFFIAAVKKQNLTICENIDDLSQKHGCIITAGVAKKDLSVCQRFFDLEKDDCYFTFAYSLKESKMCEKIEGQTLKDSCYFQIAFNTRDRNICDKIMYNITRAVCACYIFENQSEIHKCLQNFAKAKQDATICDEIPLEAGVCYGLVASEKRDPLICEKTIGDNEARNSCIITYNVIIYGISYCDKLKGDYKNKCIELAS